MILTIPETLLQFSKLHVTREHVHDCATDRVYVARHSVYMFKYVWAKVFYYMKALCRSHCRDQSGCVSDLVLVPGDKM